MQSIAVAPRFSAEEMSRIDSLIESGAAKSRADLVRYATKVYIDEMEGKRKPTVC
jgi:Arc/MetJ-type ribon-helix-helix transcriptional regulator